MIPFRQAKARLHRALDEIWSLPNSETIPVTLSLGRVVSTSIVGSSAVPPFDTSAMDGFAIRSVVMQRASSGTPMILPIQYTVQAGKPMEMPLQAGSAVRIMTGAPIPKGADTVVPKEDITEAGDQIQVRAAVREGQHIRQRGEDIAAGAEAVPTGTRISPGVAGLIAACGSPTVDVSRIPHIAVVVTGNELVPQFSK